MNNRVLSGLFSIIAARFSRPEPIKRDSDTNASLFDAIIYASSIFEAYCNISLAIIEIGVLDLTGGEDFAAFIVIVSPFSFIPESTPDIPAQPTDKNL